MSSVMKVVKNTNFTVMSNYHLCDIELSLEACGLLSRILSLPPEWEYSVAGLTSICSCGRDKVKNVLKELENRGYLHRERRRDSNGRLLQGNDYYIYENPADNPFYKGNLIQPYKLQDKFEVVNNAKSPRTENPPQVINTGFEPKTENPPQVKNSGFEPKTENPFLVETAENPLGVDLPTLVNPQQLNTNNNKILNNINKQVSKGASAPENSADKKIVKHDFDETRKASSMQANEVQSKKQSTEKKYNRPSYNQLIDSEFDDEAVRAMLKKYIMNRLVSGDKMTNDALLSNLHKLKELYPDNPSKQVRCIEQAMRSNHKTFYELTTDKEKRMQEEREANYQKYHKNQYSYNYNSFEQHNYDFDALEKMLLDN